MERRLLLILTIGSLVALVVVNLDPVTTKLHRLVILCAITGIWLGPLLLMWKRKAVRIALCLVPVLMLLPFLLPGKEINRSELREDFLKRMVSYEGTEYHWGGESGRGIDCSGLPRRAMREALFSNGIRHLDGGSMRLFLKHWWNDASAKALAEGHLDFTIPTGETGTIAKMDYAKLQPGDLVVTEDRRHILAFLGAKNGFRRIPVLEKSLLLTGGRA